MAELNDTVEAHVRSIAERDVTIQVGQHNASRCMAHEGAQSETMCGVQVLQDEVQALQLELVQTAEKLQTTERDYEQLLDRWIKKKNEEAQKVNEANLIYETYATCCGAYACLEDASTSRAPVHVQDEEGAAGAGYRAACRRDKAAERQRAVR